MGRVEQQLRAILADEMEKLGWPVAAERCRMGKDAGTKGDEVVTTSMRRVHRIGAKAADMGMG